MIDASFEDSEERIEAQEGAKRSGKIILPRVMRMEFRFAGAKFIAQSFPANYEAFIPIIQTCLTYPEIREELRRELPKFGIDYNEVIEDNGLGGIFEQAYLRAKILFGLLDQYAIQTPDEKKVIELIGRQLKEVCLGLPSINRKLLYVFILCIKKTDLAAVGIPQESVFGDLEKRNKFSYDQQPGNFIRPV